jgi:hypothetical protein
MNDIISISAFALLTLLWMAFGFALLFNRPSLERAWQWFSKTPLLVKLLLVLLFLPVVLGLWVWNTRWPFWLRLTLVAGLAWMTIYTFFPKQLLA